MVSYRSGVRSIERLAAVVDWDAPTPCREWRTIELLGHLVAIVRYYHRLLDAASAGQPLGGLPQGLELEVMNADELAALAEVGGVERARGFVAGADAYGRRLQSADWLMTLGAWSRTGALTVGQHTQLVLGEWHVHAWDLARSAGLDYRPDDPLTVAEGLRSVGRVPRAADPWLEVLAAFGRDPGWSGNTAGTA